MKTENKKERDKGGKEGSLSLKIESYLSFFVPFFLLLSYLSHFIPARLTSPLQELPLHIDPLNPACVWDIFSTVISLQFSSPSFHQKETKKKKENFDSLSSYPTSSQATTLASP